MEGHHAAGGHDQQDETDQGDRLDRQIGAVQPGAEHPQGDKVFNGKIHQCFGHQNISMVENQMLKVVHRTSIEDGMYEPAADYTTMPL